MAKTVKKGNDSSSSNGKVIRPKVSPVKPIKTHINESRNNGTGPKSPRSK